MQSVKVRRSQVTAEQAAEVIRHQLGGGYEVVPDGATMLHVRKGMAKAKVSLRDEPGGTVFDVQGEGSWGVFPIFNLYTKMINERGIARRTASALGEARPSVTTAEPLARPPAVSPGAVSAGGAGPEPAISVRGLRMSYGSYEAVRGIDLEVAHGEILAFLGPNGAGKTTTTEILEGFRKRTSGDVRVLGTDPERAGPGWRARIGVVLQTNAPERLLTVRECLTMYAGYYPKPLPVNRAIELTGLSGKADSRCDQLSGGQQRRLDVALALIGDPELIFLDEPTTGFDPSARRQTWEVVSGLRDLGKTVFLTTHFMDEAEALADRIMILAAGRIVASGTPQTIGGRDVDATLITFTVPDGAAVPALPGQTSASAERGRVRISVPEPAPALHALTGWALGQGLPLHDLAVQRPSLEDIYLQLTADSHGGTR